MGIKKVRAIFKKEAYLEKYHCGLKLDVERMLHTL
jgi:hypothetical protein